MSKVKNWLRRPGLKLAASICQDGIDAHERALDQDLNAEQIERHMTRQEVCGVLRDRVIARMAA